ncbi:hypothetical protein [Olsenella profusa]|nr:hypothetical protein [Olsenella profusa]
MQTTREPMSWVVTIAAEAQPVRRTGRERCRPRACYSVDLSDLLARAHGGDER